MLSVILTIHNTLQIIYCIKYKIRKRENRWQECRVIDECASAIQLRVHPCAFDSLLFNLTKQKMTLHCPRYKMLYKLETYTKILTRIK